MASRWLAMICACQTKATDIMLSETTQSMRTRVTLDSWTGRVKARRIQSYPRSHALRCFAEHDVRCLGLASADHCQSTRGHPMARKLQVRGLIAPSPSTRAISHDSPATEKELLCSNGATPS